MKNVVLYHANCTDGFGAAFAAWLKLGSENTAYIPVHYDANRDWVDFFVSRLDIDDQTHVYVLDFSFDRDTTEWLFRVPKRTVWLDHHRTAFEMWCGEARERYEPTTTAYSMENYILLDNNKSGALLAWEHFHPGMDTPLMFKHIDDRDRWQFELDNTREFNAALRSWEPWSFEQWQTLLRDMSPQYGGSSGHYTDFCNQGSAILRAHDQHVKAIAHNAVTVGMGGRAGLAVNCPPMFASDVGHELATKGGTFGLCWHTPDGVVARCSLRSNGDYDVSMLAKGHGGGGHKNAAGFEVPLRELVQWWM